MILTPSIRKRATTSLMASSKSHRILTLRATSDTRFLCQLLMSSSRRRGALVSFTHAAFFQIAFSAAIDHACPGYVSTRVSFVPKSRQKLQMFSKSRLRADKVPADVLLEGQISLVTVFFYFILGLTLVGGSGNVG